MNNAMTPEELALDALERGVPRSSLPMAAQLAYDRLRQPVIYPQEPVARDEPTQAYQPRAGRTPPEVREQILRMFKGANSKYAKPFEKDRLAVLSVMGGNWEEYGSIVLQMAILDTLLSIEEKLGRLAGDAPD
jgi:hypothetical protein